MYKIGVQSPNGRGDFWVGEGSSYCKVQRVICAKMAEPIEMP